MLQGQTPSRSGLDLPRPRLHPLRARTGGEDGRWPCLDSEIPPGIPDYEVLRRIGRGADGEVAANGVIASGITERCADALKSAVVRLASPDVPVPFSPILENAYRPDVARIVETARRLVSNKNGTVG